MFVYLFGFCQNNMICEQHSKRSFNALIIRINNELQL